MQKKYWTQSNINYNFKKLSENQEYKEIIFFMNMYQNPTANIILNGEKLGVFSLRSEIRQDCPLFLFNIILKDLHNAARKHTHTHTRYTDWERRNKTLQFFMTILHVKKNFF